jgi:hypothetical protein
MVITPSWCLGDPEAEFGQENVYPNSGFLFPTGSSNTPQLLSYTAIP